MNRKELEQLIDKEVSRVFSNSYLKEPEIKSVENSEIKLKKTPLDLKANLSEEELDDFLFYGGLRQKEEE
jgi:hypothetical protein